MSAEPEAAMLQSQEPHLQGCASPRLRHVLALLDEMRDSLARAQARCASMLDDPAGRQESAQ